MLIEIHPKLPMRNKAVTLAYYTQQLGFERFGNQDYDGYLMLCKDNIQLHFFEYKDLDPSINYGQVYIRVRDIDTFYKQLLATNTPIHPNGPLETKPWGQREFALLDPDNNLLTFGEAVG